MERIDSADVLYLIRRRIQTLESELSVALGERDEARVRAARYREDSRRLRKSVAMWKARAQERQGRLEYRSRARVAA